MASKAKAIPVFFMAAVLLKVRAFCAFTYPDTAVTSLVQIEHWLAAVRRQGSVAALPRRNREMHENCVIYPDF
jgi:hypothetical protein